eukprot:1374203-Amorphochlora_amoeboformis.AAC.1
MEHQAIPPGNHRQAHRSVSPDEAHLQQRCVLRAHNKDDNEHQVYVVAKVEEEVFENTSPPETDSRNHHGSHSYDVKLPELVWQLQREELGRDQ